MIDRPGPWGTGPFQLTDGYSSLDAEWVQTAADPVTGTWIWHEDRTPEVRLEANERYWNRRRGPRLRTVVFRNDLTPQEALARVCEAEGEVDLVTEIAPADAARVSHSTHARLVERAGAHVVAGIIDRDADGLPLHDRRARQALNLAVDRSELIADAVSGHGRPLSSLTPPTALTGGHLAPDRLRPHAHDPARARALWEAAGGAARPLRLAALPSLGRVAERVAFDLRRSLGIDVVTSRLDRAEALRDLARRDQPRPWDVLLVKHVPQSLDAPPHELHRGFAAADGEYRAGPVLPEFEALYQAMLGQTGPARLVAAANRVDRYVRRESLALFLYAPSALYAVNRRVDFKPYATSLELAETSVGPRHWSRRG